MVSPALPRRPSTASCVQSPARQPPGIIVAADYRSGRNDDPPRCHGCSLIPVMRRSPLRAPLSPINALTLLILHSVGCQNRTAEQSMDAGASTGAPPASVASAESAPSAALACRETTGCREDGLCTPVNDDCEVASNEDCAASTRCRTEGECVRAPANGTVAPTCTQGSDPDCRVSARCRNFGECFWGAQACVAKDATDCRNPTVAGSGASAR